MNAAKMTLVSTVVAAVLGLALGFWATSAEAHCRGKHLDADGTCIHADQNQRSQTFMVELIEGDVVTTPLLCEGSSKRKKVTDANFPPSTVSDCEGLTLLTDPNLHLCQVNINNPDRPDMSVTMFFTSGVGVEGGVLCPGDVYVGEFDAEFVDCPPPRRRPRCHMRHYRPIRT